jgi:hypothetical protein
MDPFTTAHELFAIVKILMSEPDAHQEETRGAADNGLRQAEATPVPPPA